MYKLGKTSRKRLKTCNSAIQNIINEAIKTSPIDFTILCGHRSKEEQKDLWNQGRINPGKIVTWTLNSQHNANPSNAIDIAPWIDGDIPWNNIPAFKKIGNHIKQVAEKLGYNTLIWGGDFHNNKDYPHFQIVQDSNF